MRKPLSTVCFELARHAAEAEHELLAYMLRMAAGEAQAAGAEAPPTMDQFAGVFDWDVTADIAHTDAKASEVFGVDPVKAAIGVPLSTYVDKFHPDDIASYMASIHELTRTGGAYYREYRVVQNNRVRWLAAQGHLLLDKSGRPLRLPGVLFDITHRKMAMPMSSHSLN